jgi:hypothetical protein
MKIIERVLNGVADDPAIRQKLFEFSGEKERADVNESIDYEQPHQKKMPGHAFGETMMNLKRADVRRDFDVDIIGPIDQKPAPDHEKENGHVEPMGKANEKMVLFPHGKTLKNYGRKYQNFFDGFRFKATRSDD